MDVAVFFEMVRQLLFGGRLSRAQVKGIEQILAAWPAEGDMRQLAYVLATAHHETGATMRPVREIGRGRGRLYGRTDPETGRIYYGRGYVQLTWRENYRTMGRRLGLELERQPDLALAPKIAADILVIGMVEGLFTGHRLAEFLDGAKADWRGARRIVNRLDRASDIAALGRGYAKALEAAAKSSAVIPDEPPKAPRSGIHA